MFPENADKSAGELELILKLIKYTFLSILCQIVNLTLIVPVENLIQINYTQNNKFIL